MFKLDNSYNALICPKTQNGNQQIFSDKSYPYCQAVYVAVSVHGPLDSLAC